MAEAVQQAKVVQQAFSEIWGGAGGLGGGLFNIGIAKPKLEELKTLVKSYVNTSYLLGYDGYTLYSKGKLGDFYTKVLDTIAKNEAFSIDAWSAGLGMGLGGSLAGAVEKYLGTSRLVSIVKGAMYQEGVAPWIERYFKSQYTPTLPDVTTAFHMVMEGKLSRAQFNDICLLEGWGEGWDDKLFAVLDREPNEYLAFSMYKRGLITETAMKQCFKIRGYTETWHTPLYQALHRRPTFREITSLADFVPLPSLWVTEVLRQQGYTDGDINYINEAISLRPLREEVRSVVGRYLWEYQIGRLDRDTLKSSLTALKLNPKEIELNLLWGDLRYADELLDEKIEILEERTAQGDPELDTQAKITTAIKALGILEEKANLMGELWYYKYIYVPP